MVLDHRSMANIIITKIVVPNNTGWLKKVLRNLGEVTTGLLTDTYFLGLSLVNTMKLQAMATIIQNIIKSVTAATPRSCSNIRAKTNAIIPIRKTP